MLHAIHIQRFWPAGSRATRRAAAGAERYMGHRNMKSIEGKQDILRTKQTDLRNQYLQEFLRNRQRQQIAGTPAGPVDTMNNSG